MVPDKVLYNGTIITLEDSNPRVEALAIRDGEIIALGSNEEILALSEPREGSIDLKGKTVVPGFTDAHVHFMATGLNMLGIKLNQANSVEEVLEKIKEGVERLEPGQLVLASGLDTNNFEEERYPTLQELDRIAPDNPVFINRVDSHSCFVNSQTIDLIKLPIDMQGVETNQDGQPNGFMRKKANSFVRNKVLGIIPEKRRIKAARVAAKEALKVGITTVHALEGGPLFNYKDVKTLINIEDQLPIHLVIWHQTMDMDQIEKEGLIRVGGCIVLDGSFTSRTAAINEDYSDDPGNNGVLYYDQETVDKFVERAHKSGVQISVHVLGERAIDQILTAYQKAFDKYPRQGVRHRLEHFELPSQEQIEWAADLGIILSMQPAFEYYWGGSGMYGSRLGKERALRTNPFRSIVDAGGTIIGGSDSDVTEMNPLVGIQGAITHSNPEQRLTPKEALRLFTINPAYSVFEETLRGTIKVGKYADLTVLDQNPLEINPENIDQIKVEMTICEGEIAYSLE